MDKPSLKNIKNIIFDLGGVVIDLDLERTVKAFCDIFGDGFRAHFQAFVKGTNREATFFEHYEAGAISDEKFRAALRQTFGHTAAADHELDHAWNAMLLDVPAPRAHLIKQLGQQYRTFALSNTNAIHQRAFEEILLRNDAVISFQHLFEKVYYSHLVGDRKPHVSIFQKVLTDNNLNPNETLFIDDSAHHVAGAKAAGLHAVHLLAPMTIHDLFS
jgi:putative hydrolase of the HAD superfamily